MANIDVVVAFLNVGSQVESDGRLRGGVNTWGGGIYRFNVKTPRRTQMLRTQENVRVDPRAITKADPKRWKIYPNGDLRSTITGPGQSTNNVIARYRNGRSKIVIPTF